MIVTSKEDSDVSILKSLRMPNGLFIAAPSEDYRWAWIRDNVWEAIGLEMAGDKTFVKTYHALFDVLKKHEKELDSNFIFAKYDPVTMEAYRGAWGNRQNDAVGLLLFKIGEIYKKGIAIFRDQSDISIAQKLVDYLERIEYWKCRDNGIWEENEEIHASSLGACVAGLKSVKGILQVKDEIIEKGEENLSKLLPRESDSKDSDLALLNLIFPFNIANGQSEQIISKVENSLVRDRGAIRYVGDKYFFNGGEAQWTMAFPWLAIIFKKLGNKKKYQHYMKKTEALKDGKKLPELYFSNVHSWNENTPLGWAHSLNIIAKFC
jgi:GH15 family glucan-1,4-alpha-glucosidase